MTFTSGNQTPTAVATGTPTTGPTPLTVSFSGSSSSDPDVGDTLVYAWDLDADGAFDDSAAVQPTFTYTVAGTYNARLQVTDNHGASDVSDPVVITAGTPTNAPPVARIDTPQPTLTWRVGDAINFAGSATDPQQGTLPASALSWSLILHHCPSTCHTHPLQTFEGVASGSFNAPDHDYPSHLELRLTATDSGGLTDTESVLLNPQTVTLSFVSVPAGPPARRRRL